MFGATKTTEGTNLIPREKRPGDAVVNRYMFSVNRYMKAYRVD